MEAQFRRLGSPRNGYPSIVASGDNACILHYIKNRAEMREGDLLLIDAGAEYDGYASDITRTFPVNGRFEPAQRDLYELVLAAQVKAIDKTRKGNQWDEVHEAAVEVVAQGMLDLGILQGSLDEVLEEELLGQFYVHKTGHWLGLDVHDVGDYRVAGEWRLMEPGMVMTVEPGIYISPDNTRVARKWRGIGIRIEDDVIVTPQGHEVSTAAVPKNVDEIEALMAT